MTQTEAQRHAAAQYATRDRLTTRIDVHRFGTRPVAWHTWVAARLPLAPGEAVLEVGAGTGALWAAVDRARLAPRLTLTDASAAMCAALRSGTAPPVTVLRCRAESLPLPDAGFDGVIANHMLHHLDDPAAGLAQLRRVLRPGGWLVATTVGHRNMPELRELARAAGVRRAAPELLDAFDDATGPALVGRMFERVRVRRYHNELVISEAGPVLEYVATFADTPLSAAETAALRTEIEAVIAAAGAFRIRKRSAMIIARRPA